MSLGLLARGTTTVKPARQTKLIVGLAVFLMTWTLTTHGKPSNSGDEPHYLMVAESLLRDRDLDLENNYRERHGAVFGRADLLVEAHARRTPSGALLPVHDVGLPVLLLPLYASATRISSVMPEQPLARFRMNRGLFAYSLIGLILMGLTTVAALFFLAVLSDWCEPRVAALAAVAIFVSPPILANGFVVFPEVPALFVSMLALYYAYRRPPCLTFAEGVALAALVSMLPWLHRKYALFAFGLAAVVAIRNRQPLAALGARKLALLLILLVVPLLALLGWTWSTWGNWAGPLATERVPLSIETFKHGAIGLVIDRESGLLAWAPIFFALPAASWVTRRETWAGWIPVILLFAPSAAHDQWWAGWSPVGRFLVPLIPWIAFPLSLLLRDVRVRGMLGFLMLIQLFIIAHGWQRPRSFWPKGDGVNTALEAVPLVGERLAAGFPSLRVSNVAPRDCIFPLSTLSLVTGVLLLVHRRQPEPAPTTSRS